jgi:hypothetical protein
MGLQSFPEFTDLYTTDVPEWVETNAEQITVETLLGSKVQRSDILLYLLKCVRAANKLAKPFKTNSRTQVVEANRRAEVHDSSSKFNFGWENLKDYHPINNAEIISILLKQLDSMGINARK